MLDVLSSRVGGPRHKGFHELVEPDCKSSSVVVNGESGEVELALRVLGNSFPSSVRLTPFSVTPAIRGRPRGRVLPVTH